MFRDKVPTFDFRRVYNLRSYLLKHSQGFMVPISEEIRQNVDSILGHVAHGGIPKKAIVEYITTISEKGGSCISIAKLDEVIAKFEASKYQAH